MKKYYVSHTNGTVKSFLIKYIYIYIYITIFCEPDQKKKPNFVLFSKEPQNLLKRTFF